mmetsp:Transcript_1266/g.3859  ORF Transcript_1266/g.3859 Transcript_1266/m.3859 type:complete len:291 (-) Transcript_1266:244-1116(-)
MQVHSHVVHRQLFRGPFPPAEAAGAPAPEALGHVLDVQGGPDPAAGAPLVGGATGRQWCRLPLQAEAERPRRSVLGLPNLLKPVRKGHPDDRLRQEDQEDGAGRRQLLQAERVFGDRLGLEEEVAVPAPRLLPDAVHEHGLGPPGHGPVRQKPGEEDGGIGDLLHVVEGDGREGNQQEYGDKVPRLFLLLKKHGEHGGRAESVHEDKHKHDEHEQRVGAGETRGAEHDGPDERGSSTDAHKVSEVCGPVDRGRHPVDSLHNLHLAFLLRDKLCYHRLQGAVEGEIQEHRS